MSRSSVFRDVADFFRTLSLVVFDLVRLAVLAARSHSTLAAENLFLRKQLALFQERKIKPRRAGDSTRWMMATLSRMFQWRDALVNVKPDTLIRCSAKDFGFSGAGNRRPAGRPRLAKDLRQLIREMAAENPTWGEERIANELKLKLGRVSPRTVEKYLRDGPVRTPDPKQRYGSVALGPNLETHTVSAAGDARSVSTLFVGTRDQLSTIFRLSLAEQLQSAVLLDDQLTQSDARRMAWPRDLIRQLATNIQILVFTCRPSDYLLPMELKPSKKSEVDRSLIRSINLLQVIERSDITSSVADVPHQDHQDNVSK